MAYTREQICNMAMTMLRSSGTILDISNPTTTAEKAFNFWYDNVKNEVLRYADYRDSVKRATITNDPDAPEDFTYKYKWQLPADCVKFLGIGRLSDYNKFGYVIENKYLCLKHGYRIIREEGGKEIRDLDIRYVYNIDEADMSDDFAKLLSYALAACPGISRVLTDSDTVIANCVAFYEAQRQMFSQNNKQETRPMIIRDKGRFGRVGNRWASPYKIEAE